MKIYDVLWVEDDSSFVDGSLANFKEDREDIGYAIVPWHYTSLDDFNNNSHLELRALHMKLICVDYNLPGGVNGNEVIKHIRSHKQNSKIPIIFYSAAKTEQELKEIMENTLEDITEVYFAHKDTLEDLMSTLLE